MRIISFDYEPSSKRGGQELALVEVLNGLKRLGHSIELGYVKPGDLLFKYHKNEITTIQLERLNLLNKLSFTEYNDFFSATKLFTNPKGSIVYINQLNDAPLAVLLKILYGCKIICHLRLPPLGKSPQIKLSVPFIDNFIVANRHMFRLHTAQGISAKKTVIVPDGLWINEVSSPLKQSNSVFKIAYIGRIDHIKGIHVLIDAAVTLKEKGMKFQLDIAGQPMDDQQENYLQYLKKKTNDYHLDDSIFFLGHISKPIEHLAKYDLCVFPSIWEEPFGRVIVESILAETPVIGNDVGSVAEIMNDGNKEWVYNSTEELVDKIMLLNKNPELYPIQEKITFVKENFDLNNIILKIQSVLENT